MKKQTWTVFSLMALFVSLGSMPAHAGRDPDLAVPRSIQEAEAREWEYQHGADGKSHVGTPALPQVDNFSKGKMDGVSDGREMMQAQICESSAPLNVITRTAMMRAVSNKNLSGDFADYSRGYDIGFEAGLLAAKVIRVPCPEKAAPATRPERIWKGHQQ